MLESINKYNKAFILCQPINNNNNFKRKLFKFKIDNYICSYKQNYSLNKISKMEKSRIRPFGKWYIKNINKKYK